MQPKLWISTFLCIEIVISHLDYSPGEIDRFKCRKTIMYKNRSKHIQMTYKNGYEQKVSIVHHLFSGMQIE